MYARNGWKLNQFKNVIAIIISLSVLYGCQTAGQSGAGFNERGIEAGKAGLHDQALEWFNKAIAQNPNQSD